MFYCSEQDASSVISSPVVLYCQPGMYASPSYSQTEPVSGIAKVEVSF